MAFTPLRDHLWVSRLKAEYRVELLERRLRYHLAKKFRLPLRYGGEFVYADHARPGALGQFPRSIPRIVWLFWGQGFDQAPDVIKACLTSWRRHNPDWEVHELDLNNVHQYVKLPSYADPMTMPLAAYGDILRIHLLEAHGGVWADATVFCSKPLAEWLPPLMQSGFFAFTKPARGRPIASWFLAAEANNPIVADWRALLDRYWSTNRQPHEYFWVHRLFKHAIGRSFESRSLWSAMPKVDASGPHAAQQTLSLDAIPIQLTAALQARLFAVHKLTWKIPAERQENLSKLLKLLAES